MSDRFESGVCIWAALVVLLGITVIVANPALAQADPCATMQVALTQGPIIGPTQPPAVTPTQHPSPTAFPTQEPTAVPTQIPTEAPTEEPPPTEPPLPTTASTEEPTTNGRDLIRAFIQPGDTCVPTPTAISTGVTTLPSTGQGRGSDEMIYLPLLIMSAALLTGAASLLVTRRRPLRGRR